MPQPINLQNANLSQTDRSLVKHIKDNFFCNFKVLIEIQLSLEIAFLCFKLNSSKLIVLFFASNPHGSLTFISTMKSTLLGFNKSLQAYGEQVNQIKILEKMKETAILSNL